jgi:alpha-ketoglutaric semialdehyde dehydrogenase
MFKCNAMPSQNPTPSLADAAAEAATFPGQGGVLVRGAWVDGEAGGFETRNPAHPDQVVGRYTAASAGQVDAAVQAARSAQREWRKLPPLQRGEAGLRWLDDLVARREEIARAIVLEQGKPLAQARGEFDKGVLEARQMVGLAARDHGTVMPAARPGFRNMVLRRPRGVVAALCPWNFPVMTPLRKLAPALVFGNAVLLKPSEYTPAAAGLLAGVAQPHFAPGLVQVLNGAGAVGAALAGHPGVDAITFTGSIATGRRIQAAAAQGLSEVSLELGGKNAAIVHDATHLDAALDAIADAAFAVCGQRCTAISRIVVQRGLHDRVAQGLVARAHALRLGDGLREGTTAGPLIHGAHRDKVHGMVQRAVEAGARLLCGGRFVQPESAPQGWFYEPTVLADVRPESEIAQDEIFGPVLTLTPYDDFDQALAIVNGVEHGLTAALFSDQHALVQRFLDECETGMLHVNHGTAPDAHMPFGGIKHSGVGVYSSCGPSAMHFYTTEHAVYLKA